MSTHNFDALRKAILAISDEKEVWSLAVKEFHFVGAVSDGDWLILPDGTEHPHATHCPCGKAINHNCVISHHSGQTIAVGSTCVTHFANGNAALVREAEQVMEIPERWPCEVCDKMSANPRACNVHLYELQQRDSLVALAAAQEKWDRLIVLLDVDRLNPTERKFVCESVRRCIFNGYKLSDPQRNWLRKICKKYPRRPASMQ